MGVETEEIEYEKVCKEVTDVICDAPAVATHYIAKREAEAEAEADPQYLLGGYAAAPVAAPLAAPQLLLPQLPMLLLTPSRPPSPTLAVRSSPSTASTTPRSSSSPSRSSTATPSPRSSA